MKIHHKNMKQVSHDMQEWVQSNLAHLGIYECGYANYDAVNASYLTLPMFHQWYCEYMEKKLDFMVKERIEKASNYWDMNNTIEKNYNQFIKNYVSDRFYKIDFVQRNTNGFELLTVGSHRPLTPAGYTEVQNKFKQISYQDSYI